MEQYSHDLVQHTTATGNFWGRFGSRLIKNIRKEINSIISIARPILILMVVVCTGFMLWFVEYSKAVIAGAGIVITSPPKDFFIQSSFFIVCLCCFIGYIMSLTVIW